MKLKPAPATLRPGILRDTIAAHAQARNPQQQYPVIRYDCGSGTCGRCHSCRNARTAPVAIRTVKGGVQ